MVDVRPVYSPTGREVSSSRKIVITRDDGYESTILVGIGRRQMINESIHTMSFSCPNRYLYEAHIAVIMDYLGNMRIIKNRNGRDNSNLNNRQVREEILSSIQIMGLGYYESMLTLGTFNQVVAEILDEPVITTERHPLGINYRDYMIGKYEGSGDMINYVIKKHMFIPQNKILPF